MMKTVWLIIQDNNLPEHGSHNRHYHFAKYLKKYGYDPIVFVASKTRHSNIQLIEDQSSYRIDDTHGFPFVYVRVRDYGSSMKKRIRAMIEFHARLYECRNHFSKPDVVLGSSPYPLTPLLAIILARRFKCRSVCEVRDLWPLSLEEYGIIQPGGLVSRIMYKLENYLYTHADEIVFTLEGAKKYLQDKKVDKGHGGPVDLAHVHYINNGVDLQEFHANRDTYKYADSRLTASKAFRVIYTGSIRKANDLSFLLDAAKLLRDDGIEFFIFGDGEEEDFLKSRCRNEVISNVYFMGKVDKSFVPSVLSQGSLLLMLYSKMQEGLSGYGMSQNKLFDYLASGKPILSNLPNEYSVINGLHCGVEHGFETPQEFADQIAKMRDDSLSRDVWSKNAQEAAEKYSFEVLSQRLVRVVEGI